MGPDGVIVAITGTLVAMLLISTGFIVFIVLFHRSKRKALEQRQAAELEYLRQLGDLEHEIRDALGDPSTGPLTESPGPPTEGEPS